MQNFPLDLISIFVSFCLVVPVFSRADDLSQPAPDPAFVGKGQVIAAEPFDLANVRLLDGICCANQESDGKYLLALDPDRLLHNFRVNAKLPAPGEPYGGWEAANHGLRGHFVGHYLSACAEMYAATGDRRFLERGSLLVGELEKCQAALGGGYLSAFPAQQFDKLTEQSKTADVPYYTVHKIMAGLMDQYHYCHDARALAMVAKMADYFRGWMARFTPEQIEGMLNTAGPGVRHEYGGMSEVLHNLYAATHEQKYLDFADVFDRATVLDPLAQGRDLLAGLHANTHIPQIVGFARHHELTGDDRTGQAARYFWSQVVNHHSYATGSDSRGEIFLKPDQEAGGLGADTGETCNVYNMLKLTEHLFAWSADPALADYYELALYNHILPSIDPVTAMTTYYISLRPGHFKIYGTPEQSFWCCTGTGVENHAKYGAAIYYHHADTLWVNLFIPSRLDWREWGVAITQNTKFPADDRTSLVFQCRQPTHLKILLRIPSWATPGAQVTINGAVRGDPLAAGSYATVDRTWNDGDRVELTLPMALHLHRASDDPKRVAVMYGPMVLAGALGTEGMPASDQVTYHRALFNVPDPAVPALTGDGTNLSSWIKPVAGTAANFTATLPAGAGEVLLKPFYDIHHERYSIYWSFHDTAH